MAKQPSNRCVIPNGKEIQRRRQAVPWTVEEMANAARCSVGTVSNVEDSRPVYAATIRGIASALNVPYAALIQGAEPPVADVPQFEVKITLSIPLTHLNQSSQVLMVIKLLQRLLGGTEMEVLAITQGSTILVIAMSEPAVRRLLGMIGHVRSALAGIAEQIPGRTEATISKLFKENPDLITESRVDMHFLESRAQEYLDAKEMANWVTAVTLPENADFINPESRGKTFLEEMD